MKKYIYILIRVFLGGSSNTVSGLVISKLPIYPFVLIRGLIMSSISLTYGIRSGALKKDLAILKSDRKLLIQIIVSCLLSACVTILFYMALKELPVSMVSIFENGVYLIFFTIMSSIFLSEKITKYKVLFITVCLVGLTLIVTKGDFSQIHVSTYGLTILSLNALIASVNGIIAAKTLKKLSALVNTCINGLVTATVGGIMILVSGQSIVTFVGLLTIPLAMFVTYSGVNSFFIKYFQGRSIQELGASKTAIFQLLIPVLSALLGMAVFSQWFNHFQYIGTGLIVYSVYKLK